MECRTLSSRLTSKEGSSNVMVSGGSEVRYVSKGLMTLGHTPSGSEGNQQMKFDCTDSDFIQTGKKESVHFKHSSHAENIIFSMWGLIIASCFCKN